MNAQSSKPRTCRYHPATAATFLFVLILLLPGGAALAAVGKILFVAGPVSIERGRASPASAGDLVEEGDVIVTGDKARAQLLMNDGARIALRSGSRYRIDEFSLPAAVNAPVQATTANAGGRTVSTLIKGGFRTTTGTIGKDDPDGYQVRTPVGTLGIRGTRYVAVWCVGDCADAPGTQPGELIDDGLYLGVDEGVITLRSGDTEYQLSAGQFLFIPAGGMPARSLDQPPVWLQQDGAGEFRVAGRGSAQPAGETELPGLNERRSPVDADADPDDGVELPEPQGTPVPVTPGSLGDQRTDVRRDLSWSIYNIDVFNGFSTAQSLPADSYALNGAGNLTRFDGDYPNDSGGIPGTFDLGTSSIAGAGGSTVAVLRWGRWSGGQSLFTGAGAPIDLGLEQQSLHWIISGPAALPPQLPITGTVAYNFAGGTSPTDSEGNVGSITAATLTADFTNQEIFSTIELSLAGNTWVATGEGTLGGQVGLEPHQFIGFYDTVEINAGQRTGSGDFSGFFSGPAQPGSGAPAGAGLTFSLRDDGGVFDATGAAGFTAP